MAPRCVALVFILALSGSNDLIADRTWCLQGLAAASRPPKLYSNDFVVVMQPEFGAPGSNRDHAERLAKRHGFENRGTVSAIKYLNKIDRD